MRSAPENFTPQFYNQDDGDKKLSPFGWDQKFYHISEGNFRFEKTSLPLCGTDLFIEDHFLIEGTLRVDGHILPNRLQLGFFVSGEARLLGTKTEGVINTISYDGCSWDTTASGPARGVTMSVGGDFINQLIPSHISSKLRKRLLHEGSLRALMLAPTEATETLKEAIDLCLEFAREEKCYAIRKEFLQEQIQDLLDLGSNIIDESLDRDISVRSRGEKSRHELAKSLENYLWTQPAGQINANDIQYYSDHLGVSRRQLQMAVEEHFNMCFTTLSRIIRLHRVKHEISITGAKHKSISSLALDYDFRHFGRFSGYYRNIFGLSPIQEKKRTSN